MKRIILCFLMSSFLFPVFAQEEDYNRLLERGIELHDKGYYNSAISCYQKCVALYPEATIPYYQMAQSYAAMNRPEDMRKWAEKALIVWAQDEHTDKITFYVEALSVYVTLIVADKTVEN